MGRGAVIRAFVALTVALLPATACLAPDTTVCASGIICPPGSTCSSDGRSCVRTDPSCGDGIVDPGEECDDGAGNSDMVADRCRLSCQLPSCGDGIIDATLDEECDDGNTNPGDRCSDRCLPEVCGNGILDVRQTEDGLVPAEDCEDMNTLELDGCTTRCRAAVPTWTQHAVPTPRRNAAMAYDASRARTILFGGFTDSGTESDETWEWDGAGWTLVESASSPRPRLGHAMAYDVRQKQVVLFGGGSMSYPPGNDTWLWDGEAWTRVERPPAALWPEPRFGASMAYDAARGRVVLFGGSSTPTSVMDDTWEWDGTTWTEVTTTPGPGPRTGHTLAYDPSRGRVVLFGGNDVAPLDDTWEWDGTAWTEAKVAGPSARSNHTMAYDAARQRIVVFGGFATGPQSDTWEWDGTAWTDVTAASPPSRSQHMMAYDVARARSVVFGGFATDLANDTWERSGTDWSVVEPPTPGAPALPPPRSSHGLAYDSARGRVVMFGGVDDGSQELGDTWEWDGTRWSDADPSGAPSERLGHALTYDASRQRVVLFGGYSQGAWLQDTWEWDGSAWTDVTPPAPADSPPVRAGTAMAYDASRRRIVLFGGRGGPTADDRLADTWEWDGSVWTELTPADPDLSPSARDVHTIAYDTARRRVVLFGGTEGAGYATQDWWEWDGTSWTRIVPSDPFPLPRTAHAMAYVPVRQSTVVYGGTRSNIFGETVEIYSDAWEWDGAAWLEVSAPNNARHGTAMAYDAARGRLVLFGGSDCTLAEEPCMRRLGDTWLFSHRAVGPEACHTGLDADSDGLVGCDDPDCWGYCYPHCPPGSTTEMWPADCDATQRHCGDAVCSAALESYRSCPEDCSAPAVVVCGDFLCDSGETEASCPGDCT